MNTLIAKQDQRITLLKGDITKLKVEAIVNAAKEQLTGGSGVDGAIHRAGGFQILQECMQLPIHYRDVRCPTGEAVITTGGNMSVPYVIHTVGPVWQGGASEEPILLKNAYRNSLEKAKEKGVHSIAFPNISTGVYAFPKHLAANIAVETVLAFLKEDDTLQQVIFCCFDEENYQIYHRLLS